MESRIPENIKLLGLIVKNSPFNYSGTTLTSEYIANIQISELEDYRQKIEMEYESNKESFTDEQNRILTDDIYFLSSIINDLKQSIN